MRHSTWLGPMIGLALQACSDDGRLVSETDRVSASSDALSRHFDPLVCTLGDECERWGELIAEPAAEASVCEPLGGDVLLPEWQTTVAGVPCAFGSCPTLDVQLAPEPGGTLLAMFRVELPSTLVRGREAGLWLARYNADGSHAGSQPWDFAIPPPGVEVRRHAQLLNDASGDPVLASARAVLPGDAARPLTIAKVGGRKEPKPRAPSVETPSSRAQRTAIGPNGELLVVSAHAIADQQRAVLTLHDRRGRVVWNRPWLDGDAATAIGAVHIDAAKRITVQVWAGDPWDGGSSIARLDEQGRVLWQRPIGGINTSLQSVVDDEGNVYVLTSAWLDELEVRLERFDVNGQSTAAWSLAQVGFTLELHRGRQGVWITNRTDVGSGSELWLLPFDAQSGASSACEGRRYAWSADWMDFYNGVMVLTETEQSEVYVANNRAILKLAGGAP